MRIGIGLFGLVFGVTRNAKQSNIRIVDGPTVNEGRIEILHDEEWGTVCDDSFNLDSAHVLCRMLGYTKAKQWYHSARYGQGEGPIWVDELKCKGTEMHLANCTANSWGETDCEHHEDVSILCNTERIPGWDMSVLKEAQIFDDNVFKIRLKPLKIHEKSSMHEKGFITDGHLEVRGPDENGEEKWRRVCSHKWTQKNSHVACGQLGFTSAISFNVRSYSKRQRRQSVEFGISGVRCEGNENNLIWCEKKIHKKGNYSDCRSHKPVIIRCKPGRHFDDQVDLKNISVDDLFSRSRHPSDLFTRLKAGGNLGSGRVEIMVDARWGTICHDNWSVSSANVVCRELGFGTAKSAFKNSEFGNGHGPVYWTNVNCTGFETNFWDCGHTELPEATDHHIRTRMTCNHGQDVSVECNVPFFEDSSEHKARLVSGRHLLEGRVEVNMNGQWGPICSNDFTMPNAIVICRQLGFGFAYQFVENLHYWAPSEGALTTPLISGLNCTGDESSIVHCQKDEKVTCESKYATPFLGLVCTERAGDLVIDTVLLEQSLHLSRVSTGSLQCAAEEKCLSSSAYTEQYHQDGWWDPYKTRTLLRFSTRVWNRGTADFMPKAARNTWDWHACHGHYHSMEHFIDYDLLAVNRTKIAEGHKASFCLEDNDCEGEADRQFDCDRVGGGEQGITQGCADTYLYNLDCQWIDVTDIQEGNYILRLHANPAQGVAETDYYNNIAVCNLIYEPNRIYAFNCHIPDDYEVDFISQFYTERAFAGRSNSPMKPAI